MWISIRATREERQRRLPGDEFLPHALGSAYAEPGHVKIAWRLRADPIGPNRTRFRTETRAVATDPVARAKFRRYWRLASPGIILIRRLMLAELKHDAERTAA